MAKNLRISIASLSAANVVNGVSLIALQALLAALLARFVPNADLEIWLVAMAYSSVPSLLTCSLSTIVARRCLESSPDLHKVIVSSARKIQNVVGICAMVILALGLAVLVKSHQVKYPHFEYAIVSGFLFLSGLGLVYSQDAQGYLIARGRNWVITKANVIGRLITLSVVAFATIMGASVTVLAPLFATSMLFSLVFLRRALHSARNIQLGSAPFLAVREEERAMKKLMGHFAVWNFASALIQQMTLPVISQIDPSQIYAAYVATTIVATVMGGLAAFGGALIAPFRNSATSKNDSQLPLLVKSTAFVAIGASGGLLVIALFIRDIAKVWLNIPDFPQAGVVICILFFMQTNIRAMAIPASSLIAVSATANRIAISPSVEVFVVMLCSVPLIPQFGVRGFLGALVIGGALASAVTFFLAVQVATTHQKYRVKYYFGYLVLLAAVCAMWAFVAKLATR